MRVTVLQSFAKTGLFAALVVVTLGARSDAQGKEYPWQKDPGPIAGTWQATCSESKGATIEITLKDAHTAVGRIANLGGLGIRGYQQGEEIIHLTADDFGKWNGQLVWRQVSGATHTDPISFVATGDVLNAVMTTDDCYKQMPKAR